MKKPKWLLLTLSSLMALAFMVSCSEDDDSTVEVNLTQDQLDAVANFVGDYTGGAMAHGGPDGTSPDSTVREVFSSISSLEGSIPVGTVVTKNTYKRGADGNKTDQLYVSFAMIKREAGYNAEGGDWEYVMIPFDETVDYTKHPYGKLPDQGTDGRGKLAMCMGCHAGAVGGDYLFVND